MENFLWTSKSDIKINTRNNNKITKSAMYHLIFVPIYERFFFLKKKKERKNYNYVFPLRVLLINESNEVKKK